MGSFWVIFGISLAAFAIWLVVRIINRRERWAKWTMLGLAAGVIGYPASFGPACWLADWDIINPNLVIDFYRPLGGVAVSSREPLQSMIFRYGDVGSPADSGWFSTSRLLYLYELLRREPAGPINLNAPP